MNKIKVAVIGAGSLGSIHARLYQKMPTIELVGVCDINKKTAKKIAKQCNTTAYTDYHQLIDKIDAASIVVPTNLHYQISKELLEKKINLLIEKPITTTVWQADQLLAIASKNNLVLQVGHIERFNAAIKAIHQLVGTPIFIECHRLGPFAKRVTDIGVVLDLMIHDIDIILYLVPSMVKEIDAVGTNVLTEYEDIANVRLKFENNTICNITASRLTNTAMRKIRIFQSNAYISLDYLKQTGYIYTKDKKKIKRKKLKTTQENALLSELNNFIYCIINKKEPIVSGKNGRDALEVALKIIEAIKNNTHHSEIK